MWSLRSWRSAPGLAMTSDPAKLFNSLRVSTAQMLGYDADQLTAAQQIRVDRGITLRLMVDSGLARQMCGETNIDVKEFVSASKELECMVGGNPEVSSTDRFGDAAREELNAVIDRFIAAKEVDLCEVLQNEEMAAIAAALPCEPTPAAPIEPEPKPRLPDNVVPIDGATRANSNLPPAHYLRDSQPREAWRDFYDGRVTGPSLGRCRNNGDDIEQQTNTTKQTADDLC
jgi:hypothetical protein